MKKGSKTIVALMLILTLLTSVFAISTVNAAQGGVIAAETVQVEDGDESVDVNISVSNNPGIMGMTLTVTFDENALELEKVADGGILGAQSHKPEHVSPYTLAWSNDTATTDITANGVIATLTFKVTANAEKGNAYPIGLSYDYDNFDIYNVNMEPVSFSMQNGEIKMPAAPVVHTHDVTKIDAKGSTCQKQGNNEYYYCEGCGKYFKDAEATVETTVDAEKLPLADHNYIEKVSEEYLKEAATCKSQAVYYKSCSVCGNQSTETFENGDLKAHDYSEEWSYDTNGHWHECQNCGDKHDEAAHISGGAATEEKAEVCTVCGYVIAPPIAHTHNLKLVEGKNASCTAEGQKAYYVCDGCGKWFEDGTASIEITDKNSIVISKKAHTPSAWIVDKEATEKEKGLQHKECTVCHVKLEEEDIPVITPQPVTNPDEQPASNPDEQPSSNPDEQPASNPDEQPVSNPDEQTTTKPVEQPSTPKTTDAGSTISEPIGQTTNTTTGSSNGAVQTGAPSYALLALVVLVLGFAIAYFVYSRKHNR